MDTVYPQPLSRICRRAERRKGNRCGGSRYRTQPVTFSEIQEVDEENIEEETVTASATGSQVLASQSEHDLKSKLESYWSNNITETENRRPERKKRTLKSLNRLMVEGCPDIPVIPASPESPVETTDNNNKPPTSRLIMQPRTSI